MKKQKTVFVGLSGGVDSSVAALRLIQQNYNVVGVFIKVWHPDFMVCNWEAERLDAMRVAAHLGIPFLTCDAEATYRDEVAKYFIDEYKAGRTPNPDVMCNQKVKFGAFIEFAKHHKADFVATGHYVQKITARKDELHRGSDSNKDQSYFLWSLSEEQLNYALFPVGNTNKEQIRAEAAKAKIPTATKQDSQGICFLGHVDIPEFLSHYITLEKGAVLNTEGVVIGEHQGAFVYTIGQRHGFTLQNANNEQVPHYVVAKDTTANTITVSDTKPAHKESDELKLSSVVLRDSLTVGEDILIQTRYRQKPFLATCLENQTGILSLKIKSSTEATAIGQSCVLYKGTHCIGGGIIS